MFITKNKHYKIIKGIQEEYDEKLKEAKDLKSIIERFAENRVIKFSDGSDYRSVSGYYDPLSQQEIILKPDEKHSMSFVSDELSENEVIIKEKSTPIIFLDKNGEIKKKGYTKQKADKGYSYKLVRE